MNTTSLLTEIEKLPIDDQVALVQQIWNRIVDSDARIALTDAQKAEISRRSAELDTNPDIAVPWEEVKRSLQERRRG